MKTTKLTTEQIRVLSILGDGKVHDTSTGTYVAFSGSVTVAGNVAAALVRRGLAKHTALNPAETATGFNYSGFGVQITSAGRALLKAIKANIADIACKATPTKVTP